MRWWARRCPVWTLDDETLKGLIRDNPAGQSRELTPFILIRPVD